MEREHGIFKQMEDLEGIFNRVDLSKIKRFSREEKNKEIQQVDIMETLSEFSDDQIKNILWNNAGIQLTEGCSNNCTFCYKQAANGVSHEFSKESLKIFFKKYSNFLDNKKPMVLYDKSDPFDKEDLIDICDDFREHKPDMLMSLTTAVPNGSEEKIINLIEKNVEIRISVHKHNFERISNLLDLAKTLIGQEIIEKNIILEPRHRGTLSPIGNGSKLRDPTISAFSPACIDGTIITPTGVFSSCMVAPTKIDPTGERYIKIDKNNYERSVVNYQQRDSYFGFYEKDCLTVRLKKELVLLPPIMDSNKEEFFKPYLDRNDNLSLMLARESYSLGLMMTEVENLGYIQNEYNYPKKLIDKYFDLLSKRAEERINLLTTRLLDETKEISDDKLIYHRDILVAYLTKIVFVLKLGEQRKGKMQRYCDVVRKINNISFTEFKSIINKD